jgi:hypothetical protein
MAVEKLIVDCGCMVWEKQINPWSQKQGRCFMTPTNDSARVAMQRLFNHLEAGPPLEGAQADRIHILAHLYLGQFDQLLSHLAESPNDLASKLRLKTMKEYLAELKAVATEAATMEGYKSAVRGELARAASGLHNQLTGTMSPMKRLEELVARLEGAEKPRRPVQRSLIYLTITLIVAVVTGFLIRFGWLERPAVDIEWEVGGIIQGVTVGTAALLAALTYARRE